MQLRAGMSLLSPGGRLALRRPAVASAAAARTNRALLATKAEQTAGDGSKFDMPFQSVLAANRGEIAVRIMRAGNELGLRTVGIFSKEDRFTQHRCECWGGRLARLWCFVPAWLLFALTLLLGGVIQQHTAKPDTICLGLLCNAGSTRLLHFSHAIIVMHVLSFHHALSCSVCACYFFSVIKFIYVRV